MIHKEEYLIMIAAYQTPKPHRHLALHLLFALDGTMDCLVDGQKISCAGICIDSNVCHTAQADGKKERELVVLVEKTSLLAQQMRDSFLWTGSQYQGYAVLPESFVNHIRTCCKNKNEEELAEMVRTLDGRWKGRMEGKDERILAVLQCIRNQQGIEQDIYKKLCETACLSQSRLSHLFKEQVGVSMAGYLTWAKLEKAFALIQAGETLTNAAVNAGFSSSSHLSSTFQKMFGITCSAFLHSL